MSMLPAIAENTTTPALESLIETIRAEIDQGRNRAYLAMDQEKKQTYWKVGKHIKQHIKQHSDRAEYGATLLIQLSQHLELGKTTLYQCVQYYESYPQIFRTSGKLTWSHYTMLLAIPEKKVRDAFEKKIIENNLSVRDLKDLIRKKRKLPSIESASLLSVTRDEPYIYSLKTIQNKEKIDLGFNIFLDIPSPKNSPVAMSLGEVPHYTYQASVLEIVDGDTLWAEINLGFNISTTQKLRLRGINAPEIETPGGIASKQYIEDCLKGCPFIAIKTYWRDKYTRYLADIFYDDPKKDLLHVIQKGNFLNQELLDKGFAVKV